ncbi:hypothetical protein JW992_06615, partial [candidate division KSB1 bacterium]|nr:hypothetical protein [candidate division KSB1 bacterium]
VGKNNSSTHMILSDFGVDVKRFKKQNCAEISKGKRRTLGLCCGVKKFGVKKLWATSCRFGGLYRTENRAGLGQAFRGGGAWLVFAMRTAFADCLSFFPP